MARGGGGRSGGGSRGGGGFRSSSSRSSRGFSSSSSRGRSSFSSGSRSSFSSGNRSGFSSGSRGGFSGSRPTMGGPRPGGYGPTMGGGPRPRNHRPIMSGPIFVSTPRRRTSGGGGGGCASGLVTVIVLMIFLMILFSMFSVNRGGNSYEDNVGKTEITSTVEREPLPSGSVNETEYFKDNLGWIQRSTELTGGMKRFYQETGVQPYLYLASENEVTQYGSLQTLAESMYDELFTDEAHFLFTLTANEYEEWEIWFVTGSQATAVIDTEAEEIIYQYFVRYYNDYSLEYEEVFSQMFEESAELMMKHVTNGFDVAKVALLVVGGVAVISIVVYGVNKHKKLKLEEQKEQNEFTERMMNVPLETFSEAETDKELEELMKKYNESQSK